MWPPPLSETPLEFEVKPRTEGKRLDVYLSNRFTDYSRRVIQKIIEADAVLVNGRVSKASYRVRPGDLVSIRLPDLPDTTPKPEDIPIEIGLASSIVSTATPPAY
jgi:23S rRNA pseudouridine1911/1915/1917 synthase